MPTWSPSSYLRFADERSRPFYDLLARVGAEAPQRVIDLGCGPGTLTATLRERWPEADIEGIDSSSAMITAAAEHTEEHLRFTLRDIREWAPDQEIDVVLSNAALQWVPAHRALLTRWVDTLAPGGWLAFQVPGNFNEPSHTLLRALADQPPYATFTRDAEEHRSDEPADYLTTLLQAGCRVDAWETTYLHLLSGPDPVFRWISGTGARPILQALPQDLREAFATDYKAQLREAYPEGPGGTILPFRRIFVVAQRLAP